MSNDISDSELYYNRRSEEALCRDFPADAAIIDALCRWQMRIWNSNGCLTIPVVRVMNCAHRFAAQMLSGLYPYDDRDGYDFRIFRDMDNDRAMMAIVIVVLATMLKRTEDSDRAWTCWNIITDDRPEDFYERLSLFDHYVDTSQQIRYREKELLRDAADLIERIAQLEAEKQEKDKQIYKLEKTIESMENETRHIGYNVEQMTINVNGGTLVQHADLVQASGEVKVERVNELTNEGLASEGLTSEGLTNERMKETKLCTYLVREKISEMGIDTPEQVESEMRAEAEKDAKHFAAWLRRKEKAGILNFHGDTKKQILITLQEHFPTMKRYTYNNFIAYF